MLADKGADVNIADTAGMAALYAAVDMNTLGEVYGRPARKSTSKVSALELMKVLLAHGAESERAAQVATRCSARHTPGEPALGALTTPLMRAAKNGDYAAIEILLDHGADPALTQRNRTTALMFASGLGRGTGVFTKDIGTERDLLRAVKVLVEHGVDVNAFNDNGQTAMHFAAQASDDIVRYLAAHGAKLEPRDKQGRTPVDLALGVGVRGRAGGPPPVRQATAALLRQLISESGAALGLDAAMKTPAFGLLLALAVAGSASAQNEAPAAGRGRGAPPRNLQVLPKDTAPQDVGAMMQQFTRALGVQCTYCHVQNTPPPLTRGGSRGQAAAILRPAAGAAAGRVRRWISPPTTSARSRRPALMLTLVNDLNARIAAIPGRRADASRVQCATCHRGVPNPQMLGDLLNADDDRQG